MLKWIFSFGHGQGCGQRTVHPTLGRPEKRGTPLFHSYYRLATQIKHFKYLFGFRCGIV